MTNMPSSDEPQVPDEGSLQPDSTVSTSDSLSIRRILVALDASTNSRAAMTTAIGLAETLKSEVHGLFIEDINLLRLAELPFAREVLYAERKLQHLEQEGIQRKLRARAAILRREIAELAAEHKVTSTFEVIRGPVSQELLAAALESDLLAIGRLGHSIIRQNRLGSTARAVINRAPSAVLLVKSEVSPGPIVALYDGSAVGLRLLNLAADLADPSGDLRVLVWGANENDAFERRQLAVRVLERHAIPVQFQHLAGENPHMVLQWVNRQKASLLLLGGGETHLPASIFQILLDEAEQHILVIR